MLCYAWRVFWQSEILSGCAGNDELTCAGLCVFLCDGLCAVFISLSVFVLCAMYACACLRSFMYVLFSSGADSISIASTRYELHMKLRFPLSVHLFEPSLLGINITFSSV